MSKINLNEIFPFIKEAIQSINLIERYADRDSIVSRLLTYPDFMKIIRNTETPERFDDIWRVGNCHAMLHKKPKPSVEELRKTVKRMKRSITL